MQGTSYMSPLLVTTRLGDNVAGLCHLVELTTLFPDGEQSPVSSCLNLQQ